MNFVCGCLRGVMVAGLIFFSAHSGFADQSPEVEWYDVDGVTRLFDAAGVELTTVENLVFQLVVDVEKDTDFDALIAAGRNSIGWAVGGENPIAATYTAHDDLVLDGFAFWATDDDNGTTVGYLGEVNSMVKIGGTNYWATPYYFRWFNSTNISTATEAGIIYNPDWVTPPDPGQGAAFPVTARLGFNMPNNEGSQTALGWQSMPLADGDSLVVVSSHGTPDPAVGTNWIATDAVVNASITDAPIENGTTQYVVIGWTGTGSVTNSAPPTHPAASYANQLDDFAFTFTNASTLTWLWATNYQLTLATDGDGDGGLDTASGWRKSDGGYTITATADAFMEFTGWSGDTNGCTIAGNQLTITSMDGPRSITASFDYGYTALETPVRWYIEQEQGIAPDPGDDWDDVDLYDMDGDGFVNWLEYIAGTDPQDAASYFRVISLSRDTTDGTTLNWFGGIGPNTDWIIHARTNLTTGDWAAVSTVPRSVGTMTNTWVSGSDAVTNMLYRVRTTRW